MGVIDIQIYTHFKLNLCLCWIQGKPNMYFFFSFSPKHQNSGMLTTHMDSFLKRVSHSLRFTQFSLHIKKAIPLCYVLHACMYVFWVVVYIEQTMWRLFYWHLQSNVTSEWHPKCLKHKIDFGNKYESNKHTQWFIYTHIWYLKKKLIELRIEIRIFTPKENDFWFFEWRATI